MQAKRLNMIGNKSKVCRQCVLPGTFPGIRFNSEGVCNHCEQFNRGVREHEEAKSRYRQKFEQLLERVLQGSEQRPYDAVMAYSGGKDSTYTLMMLVQHYRMRVLALTFDNGFMSERAKRNIHAVAEHLDVGLETFRPAPKKIRHAFRESMDRCPYAMKTLERASALCNTCMNLVKSYVIKTAIEKDIPLLVYGWSPGQAPVQSSVFRMNPAVLRQAQKQLRDTLAPIMFQGLEPFILAERHYRLLDEAMERSGGDFLYAVHPLAFLDYDEENIRGKIAAVGWSAPLDTDANSTNCLVNGYANSIHQARYGFHPYAFEIAGLVRYGHMTREEGLAKLNKPVPEEAAQDIRKKLEIG